MTIQENSMSKTGTVGNLTPPQEKALKQFWDEFFRLAAGSLDVTKNTSNSDNNTKSKEDEDALKERQRIEENYKEAKHAIEHHGADKFMASFWKLVAMDDPDSIMLRFLRARKWNVNAGVTMLAACLKWRMESNVEEIMEKGEEGMKHREGFIKQLERGKGYVQGTDRLGRPILYIHVAKHKPSDQTLEELQDFCLFQIESVRLLLYPTVDKVTLCFDMTGFGMSNMDWKILQFIIKCLEAYYPESLNAVIVHSAPWVFQGIWKLVAPMLDPVVRAKVQFTKKTDDLTNLIHKEHLLKSLGGSNDWEWKYTPVQEGENKALNDEDAKQEKLKDRNDLIKIYEQVTKDWLQLETNETSDNNDSEKAQTIVKYRQLLTKALRAQYWELDHHSRGRSVYHRHKNIVGNGLVQFSYSKDKAQKQKEQQSPPTTTSSSSTTTTNGNKETSPSNEHQVLGHDGTKECMQKECAKLKTQLGDNIPYDIPDIVTRIIESGNSIS